MLAFLLCAIALVGAYSAAKRCLGAGLVAVLCVGYWYGIIRANLLVTASHFLFDAAVIGFYLALLVKKTDWAAQKRASTLFPWLAILSFWPTLLFLNPAQDWLIQLVGLRGAIFFLPFLLVGAYVTAEDLSIVATGIAVLNAIEVGVAVFEFLGGLQQLYPYNPVTEIIYDSHDLAGNAYRIPGTFANPAAYGGTMALVIPLLAAVWASGTTTGWRKRTLEAGMLTSAVGVFLCGCRTPAILLFCIAAVVPFALRLKGSQLAALLLLSLLTAWIVTKDARLQRFLELSDTSVVQKRVTVSLNSSFAQIVHEYPMGNGLGAGGTSIPYFLEERLHRGMIIENDYGRLVLEQGVIGLTLWIVFLVWLFCYSWPSGRSKWDLGRKMCWVAAAFSFVDGCIGLGLLTAIPSTPILLLISGWLVASKRDIRAQPGRTYQPTFAMRSCLVAPQKVTP